MKDNNTFLYELLAVIHGDGGYYQAEHGTEKAFDDAIEKIYSLKLQDKSSNWISVVDELPQKETTYLCYFSDGSIESFVFLHSEAPRWLYGFSSFSITHWMHLPEPPTESF